jgi:hypothetical protein
MESLSSLYLRLNRLSFTSRQSLLLLILTSLLLLSMTQVALASTPSFEASYGSVANG